MGSKHQLTKLTNLSWSYGHKQSHTTLCPLSSTVGHTVTSSLTQFVLYQLATVTQFFVYNTVSFVFCSWSYSHKQSHAVFLYQLATVTQFFFSRNTVSFVFYSWSHSHKQSHTVCCLPTGHNDTVFISTTLCPLFSTVGHTVTGSLTQFVLYQLTTVVHFISSQHCVLCFLPVDRTVTSSLTQCVLYQLASDRDYFTTLCPVFSTIGNTVTDSLTQCVLYHMASDRDYFTTLCPLFSTIGHTVVGSLTQCVLYHLDSDRDYFTTLCP